MWLPAFKILKGLFALKGKFTLAENGAEYEGPYFTTSQGESFTGSHPSPSSQKIIALPDHEHEEDFPGEGNAFSNESPYPRPEDYKTGYFKRHFVLDTRNGVINEVLKSNYTIAENLLYMKTGTVDWVIEKPVKDIFNQGYLFKGAATRNRESILKLSLSLPKIDEYITDYGKFADIESDVEGYRFEELPRKEQERIIKKEAPTVQQYPIRKIKPRFKDKKVRKLKTKNNLYTSGGRFKIKGTNTEYKGFYHFHPSKGPMEGRQHTSSPHRRLEPIGLIPTNQSTQRNSGGGGSQSYDQTYFADNDIAGNQSSGNSYNTPPNSNLSQY